MPYEDLGNTIGHAFDGYYNITLDTSSLHDGQIGRVDIAAGAEGYSVAHLNFTFQVLKIPFNYLLLETDTENLTVYEGESIRIGASFKDLFHDRVLFSNPSEGNLTWRINSSGASDFHLMDQLLTVYIADIALPQYNVTAGIFNLTIETRASIDYENVSIDIRLEVLPKEKVILELYNIPAEILSGKSLTITAKLYYTDISNLTLTEATIRFTIGDAEKFAITDNNGIAEITYDMPKGEVLLTITASYEGAASISPANDTTTIQIITIRTIIWRYSPIWLPILLTLAVILGIRLNKRIIRLTKFQKEIHKVKEKIVKKMRIGNVPQPTREALISELFEEQLSQFKIPQSRKN